MRDYIQTAAPPGEGGNIDESETTRKRIQTLNEQRQAEREFFITETELLRRIPVSRRTLFQWRASGKIPFVRISGRKLLFHWPSVESAILRQQKGGGQ